MHYLVVLLWLAFISVPTLAADELYKGQAETAAGIFSIVIIVVGITATIMFRRREKKEEQSEYQKCLQICESGKPYDISNKPDVTDLVQELPTGYKGENSILIMLLEECAFAIIEKGSGLSSEKLKLIDKVRNFIFDNIGMRNWNKVTKKTTAVISGDYPQAIKTLVKALDESKVNVVATEDTKDGARIATESNATIAGKMVMGSDKGLVVFQLIAKTDSHTLLKAQIETYTGNYFKKFSNIDWGISKRVLRKIVAKTQ